MKALLLVDLQNDFMPLGALAVSKGDQIVPFVKELVQYPFDVIVATKDWHPPDHCSFASNHPNGCIGEVVEVAGVPQKLWPNHCIQGTFGAEFAPGFDTTYLDRIFYKGTERYVDSYSAFFNNSGQLSTGLEKYLKDKNIQELFVAGLATDYCVKNSVLDAISLGFKTYVISEACRGVNINARDSHAAFAVMQTAGATFVPFQKLEEILKVKDRAL